LIYRQEAVSLGHYQRLIVMITKLDGKSVLKCVTYEKVDKNEVIGRPSPAYKNVIINGAKQINLPEDYIKFLRSFDDNNYQGEINVDLLPEFYLSS
jgi:hypothetical protein